MTFYNRGKAKGASDWTAGTWRVLLVTGAYVPNPDHNFVSDVVASEATGAGYARKDVIGRASAIDYVNDKVDFTASTVSWASLASSFRYAILYKLGTVDGDSELHSYYDLQPQNLSASPYEIRWNYGVLSGVVFRAA
jgi:hypothetical protein